MISTTPAQIPVEYNSTTSTAFDKQIFSVLDLYLNTQILNKYYIHDALLSTMHSITHIRSTPASL